MNKIQTLIELEKRWNVKRILINNLFEEAGLTLIGMDSKEVIYTLENNKPNIYRVLELLGHFSGKEIVYMYNSGKNYVLLKDINH